MEPACFFSLYASPLTSLKILKLSVPQASPPCTIHKQGWRVGCRVLTASGVRQAHTQSYKCFTHCRRWNLPVGTTVRTRQVTGDVVGNCIVEPGFWPRALRLFQETEDYLALERDIRATTADALAEAIAAHPGRSDLSYAAQQELHRRLMDFLLQTPSRQLLKKLLWFYCTTAILPRVPLVAEQLCASHGALLCVDFSASDCRQIRPAVHVTFA